MTDRLLHDFAEIASDWFWETDTDHRFCYMSDRLSEVTGLSVESYLGKSRIEFAEGQPDNPKWREHLADLNAHRPFRNLIYSTARPSDGKTVWVNISGQPCFDAEGAFTGYRGTGTNITLEVEARQELEQFNKELQKKNDEILEAQETIQHLAYHDTLTDLANRRLFEMRLQEALARGNTTVAIIHVDLDRFKQINDTLGHAAGDAVLTHAADRMKAVATDAKLIARVGGDEFILLFEGPETGPAWEQIAEDIVASLGEPLEIDGSPVIFGGSAGVAWSSSGSITPQDLVSHADIALYEAKEHGRGRVRTFTPQLHAAMLAKKRLAEEVQRAVSENQITTWFQPQVDARTRTLAGVEALARWNHPTKGILPPFHFLEPAENLGLISRIDAAILEQTLAVATRFADAGHPLPRVSVNISYRRLAEDDLIRDVQRLWTDRRTPLSFELIETILFDDQPGDIISHNLDRLRDLGVELEIDDFGTGHASITGLFHIQPSYLKIDREIVSPILEDPSRKKLVGAVLDIADALGINVVAEGVETLEQADLLESMGCHMLQGYAFAKPMSETDLQRILLRGRRFARAS
ncbi:MAG: EAL domain-containing protein [Pseudomonadota bacterium]